jgi:hypothetical protein
MASDNITKRMLCEYVNVSAFSCRAVIARVIGASMGLNEPSGLAPLTSSLAVPATAVHPLFVSENECENGC